jgi:hypothetical protein
MKKFLLYTLITILYALIPLMAFAYLGTMVTEKYQIEEARIFVAIDSKKQSEEQTKHELAEIDKLETQINLTQSLIGIGVLLFLVTATILTTKRKNILKTQHNTVYIE